jgi:transcriptional regulator with GAF, ATPase, and Fis domain
MEYNIPMLALVVDLAGKAMVYPLREDVLEVTAGSLSDNAVCIPFKGVSRRHFILQRKGMAWVITDLDSTNGLLLNGERIKEAAIKEGDQIQAGCVVLRVVESPGDASQVSIQQTPPLTPAGYATDDVGNLRVQEESGIFAFPRLVFAPGMVAGRSPGMFEVYQKLDALADAEVNVLLEGETGVGKELLARTLHLSSRRAMGPFIAVNCAAIPSELAEAEFFGIGDRVATGVAKRKGLFAQASGGTLFLDEVGSFPVALQAKVLRVIEERSVAAVGESARERLNFRLVAATNSDPRELILHGQLREDLFHRLAGVEIAIPPLRERREDILPILMALLQRFSSEEGKPVEWISKRLLARLVAYDYPGNVRELANLARSMVALAHPGEMLDVHLLPEKIGQAGAQAWRAPESRLEEGPVCLRDEVEGLTRRMVEKAMEAARGNVSAAAKRLGLTPFGLRKMMKRMGIGPKDFGPGG